MPPGIPVATVAIDGGANAAILAAKILATSDPELLQKLKDYTAEMKETVQKKQKSLKNRTQRIYQADVGIQMSVKIPGGYRKCWIIRQPA